MSTEANRIIAARIEAIRSFCADQIEHDARPGGGLTDRAWCAQSVLNILDGKIDHQLSVVDGDSP
jgi:hypothetical protein